MRKMFFLACCSLIIMACNTAEQPAAPAAPAGPAPAELTGDDYVAMGKDGLAKLSAGDVDGWMESFADNAMYQWNNGDSLAGKQAIADYWKKRRSEDITSITFSNDIWLSLKVNQPQNEYVLPGQWLFGWYQVDATYKTGKSMTQWIHTDMHLNDAGKVDLVIQYLDRAPIMKAMTP